MLKDMTVFRAMDAKISPEDLAQRMIERRLTRRVIAVEDSSEVEAWVERALSEETDLNRVGRFRSVCG